jgi:glycosyltransferase involved in cell wall biosynthesis
MRILFLSTWFPYPLNNGSKVRVYNLLRQLSRHHEVSLISFADPTAEPQSARTSLDFCHDVEAIPTPTYSREAAGSRMALLGSTPRFFASTFSAAFERCVARRLSSREPDVIIASQINAAIHLPSRQRPPAVFEEVELGVFAQQARDAKRVSRKLRFGLTWLKHRRFVAAQLTKFSACTVVSEPEAELLRSVAPNSPPITVVPNGVDAASGETSHQIAPHSLVYAGSLSYQANLEAVTWFVREILPPLRRRFPDLRFTVTGDMAGHRLTDVSTHQTGLVEDVRPFVGGAWASVLPLRTGGGTRIKALESMALGTPIVTTSKGVEGLAVRDGEHVLIADDAASFAAATGRLLSDARLRAHLSENGKRLVREHYDWQKIVSRYRDLLEALTRPCN